MTVDGILNVDKPLGWTSLDVVRFVRRHSGVRHAGHAGTLDPAAEGVLPICLGGATRLVEFLIGAPKTYHARVRLGIATTTYDAEGDVVRTGDASSVTAATLEEALARFLGKTPQVPPMFSALKKDGVPLYRYARAGRTLDLEARDVEVHAIRLIDFAPPVVTVDVECGRGFYLRSFAYDLGERLGCGAHLEHLRRTRMGPFAVEAAVGLDRLREAFGGGDWQDLTQPLDCVLLDRDAAVLGAQNTEWARSGRTLKLRPLDPGRVSSLPEGSLCRAYSPDGMLVALLRYEGAGVLWHPQRVFLGEKQP